MRARVLLLGGRGRLPPLLSRVAAEEGFAFEHYERRHPRVAPEHGLVVVVAGCCAHTQREWAQREKAGSEVLLVRNLNPHKFRQLLRAHRAAPAQASA